MNPHQQLPVPTEPDVRGPADHVGGGVRPQGPGTLFSAVVRILHNGLNTGLPA